MVIERCVSWQRPPVSLTLQSDAVHIWRAPLDVAEGRAEALRRSLSVDEISRAEQFLLAQDRDRFIVARGLLRAILGNYLRVAPGRVRFVYGSLGKPALAPEFSRSQIHFNLSHSDDLALCAVARGRRIGVDLERARPIPDARQIVEQFFSPREITAFVALSPSRRARGFLRFWTCKEAYLKAKGEGLAVALDRVDVSVVPGRPARLLSVDGDTLEASQWSLRELHPAPGYVAALVVEGREAHVSWRSEGICRA
jgi:4'-phosphopantetheinyl transferase